MLDGAIDLVNPYTHLVTLPSQLFMIPRDPQGETVPANREMLREKSERIDHDDTPIRASIDELYRMELVVYLYRPLIVV